MKFTESLLTLLIIGLLYTVGAVEPGKESWKPKEEPRKLEIIDGEFEPFPGPVRFFIVEAPWKILNLSLRSLTSDFP